MICADYLRVRRTLGCKLDDAENILGRFATYLHDHIAHGVTIEFAPS
jgi:hypothetical protein